MNSLTLRGVEDSKVRPSATLGVIRSDRPIGFTGDRFAAVFFHGISVACVLSRKLTVPDFIRSHVDAELGFLEATTGLGLGLESDMNGKLGILNSRSTLGIVNLGIETLGMENFGIDQLELFFGFGVSSPTRALTRVLRSFLGVENPGTRISCAEASEIPVIINAKAKLPMIPGRIARLSL